MNNSQSYEKQFSHAFFHTVAMCLDVSLNNLTLIGTAATVNPTASASILAVQSGTDVSGGSTTKSPTWMRGHRIASSSSSADSDSEGDFEEDPVDYGQVSYLSNGNFGVMLTYSIRDSLDFRTVQTVLSDSANDLTGVLVKAGYPDAIVSNVVSVTVLDTSAFIKQRELDSGAIATIALAGIAVTFMAVVCFGKKRSKVADEQPRNRI